MTFNPKFTPQTYTEINLDSYLELVKDLSYINKDNIDHELLTLTTYYSYYHGLMIKSKRLFDNALNKLENLKACIKLNAKGNADKKIPAHVLENMALCDKSVEDSQDDLLSKEELFGYYKSICQTLGIKKELIIQLNVNIRSEANLYK